MKRVAIQGYKGCFHEVAARQFYPDQDISVVECDTFEDLFKRLSDGTADAAVMAIENSINGGLLPNFELLRNNPQNIKGENYQRIEQNLIALPGQGIEDISEVRTHYMAINQTREFFKNYSGIRLVESEDTAKSARDIAEQQLRGVGAVGSALSARIYGLDIIAPGIETYKENFTRFLLFDEDMKISKDVIDKASICFTLDHKPGALAHILTILSFYDMNLTRIQSLPIPGHKWQYFFYADITFESYERYRQALSAVTPLIGTIRILGEYTSAL